MCAGQICLLPHRRHPRNPACVRMCPCAAGGRRESRCMCMCMRARVCVMLAETPIYTEKYIYIYKIYIYSGAMEGWFGGGNVIVQFRAASTIRALPSRRTNAYSAGNFVKEARRFRCHRDSGALQLDCSLITLRI